MSTMFLTNREFLSCAMHKSIRPAADDAFYRAASIATSGTDAKRPTVEINTDFVA